MSIVVLCSAVLRPRCRLRVFAVGVRANTVRPYTFGPTLLRVVMPRRMCCNAFKNDNFGFLASQHSVVVSWVSLFWFFPFCSLRGCDPSTCLRGQTQLTASHSFALSVGCRLDLARRWLVKRRVSANVSAELHCFLQYWFGFARVPF